MRVEDVVLSTVSGRHIIKAEIADTQSSRQTGLMFRESLPANAGMLFLHDNERQIGMWMKNTYISLDMLFITKDGRVHHIVEGTEPFSQTTISSNGKVSAVLELAAGAVAHYQIRRGDEIGHPFFSK